ncbi:MAG: DEAD/DEAH box helicase family protein [Treponema sp.]|nr:DEAD/DEAH box helicase family protein [Treponema sp.]
MSFGPLRFKFESGQPHQREAVDSVVNLFTGFSQETADFSLAHDVVPNIIEDEFNTEWLYANYAEIIAANRNSAETQAELPMNPVLEYEDGFMLKKTKFENEPVRFPVFTVEMETGTGKTYVYFRTMHELKKAYGFRKFIVVVPSIAIYEGTIKAFKQTKAHFKTLYSNENISLTEYDGQHISRLRGFAASTFTEIMVMTIDSFNKASNIIYKQTEKLQGEWLPIEYIQTTRPILILDESQNYRSSLSREALRTLNPLFAVNYSATPVDKYNLLYRLSPADAFRHNLVKRIKVHGVTQQHNLNDTTLSVSIVDIKNVNNEISAELQAYCIKDGIKSLKTIKVKKNDDLFKKTGNSDFEGFIIEEIHYGKGTILFTNQSVLTKESHASITLSKKEIFRVQIEEAVKYHFEKQKSLLSKNIKVLTLFFIDRVAHYQGNNDPFIKMYFEAAFEKLKIKDAFFNKFTADEVHAGYFARKKSDDVYFDSLDTDGIKGLADKDKKAMREAEKEAFQKIMREKEKLLSFSEKTCFIFAHSALREGWDNPNVFTICLLKDPVYETDNQKNTRRQELGRGLRLCVNQDGERVKEEGVNILTIVCPEDFSQYAEKLQDEYAATGDIAPPPPTNAVRKPVTRNEEVFNHADFRTFWENLSRQTNYLINIDTAELVKKCAEKLNHPDTIFPDTQIVISKGEIIMTDYCITLLGTNLGHAKIEITVKDTRGRNDTFFGTYYQKGFDFGRSSKDKNLSGYKIITIIDDKNDPVVEFGNGETLTRENPITFSGNPMQMQSQRTVQTAGTNYPVFNIIDRAAKAAGLTRPTIFSIFKSIQDSKKAKLFNNPEGFAHVFINEIRVELADHVANKIEYSLSNDFREYRFEEYTLPEQKREQQVLFAAEDPPPYGDPVLQTAEKKGSKKQAIEHYFPRSKEYPQRELVEGSAHCLYDHIQTDSDVEKNFVNLRLKEDDKNGNIACYFKFPGNFKIRIPKIIGNYNPDWGIVRIGNDGRAKIQLVRETKGSIDPNQLRFSNEKRKIECAKKHFNTLGISYRQVTDKIPDWWKEN